MERVRIEDIRKHEMEFAPHRRGIEQNSLNASREEYIIYLPTDSNSKSSLGPIPTFNYRHLSPHVTPRPIKDLMGMSVIRLVVGMIVTVVVVVAVRHVGEKSTSQYWS